MTKKHYKAGTTQLLDYLVYEHERQRKIYGEAMEEIGSSTGLTIMSRARIRENNIIVSTAQARGILIRDIVSIIESTFPLEITDNHWRSSLLTSRKFYYRFPYKL